MQATLGSRHGRNTVASWQERYVAAGRSYDPDEIRALFGEDAVYSFHPWDDGMLRPD